ncbi:uncharacterized protein LOC143906482 [Temnothorax americanus]|uniref:uncharacterized protein LOC143906482 n=1 Tax=Temnothorax americanus TaxID=1964332 RepID=UPI004068952C
MDYAAPSNHDVSNEVEISSNISKSLLSSDSEQTAQVEAGSSLEEENGHLIVTDARICTGGSQFVFGGGESDATQPNRQDMNTAMESFLNNTISSEVLATRCPLIARLPDEFRISN